MLGRIRAAAFRLAERASGARGWSGGSAFTPGFEGSARGRRLQNFVPPRDHVNALLRHAGPDMNARARHLVRNNGYAAQAVESWADNVVGTSIKPIPDLADSQAKAAIARAWEDWTDEADAEGLTDFYGLQRRAAREAFITGEVFLRFRPRRPEDGLSVPLQLQMLPSEMLPMHAAVWSGVPEGHVVRQGIEFDRIGRRVAYHFYRRHPGDSTEAERGRETVRVPAGDVMHVIDPVEAGQLRGVSRFAPAIVKLYNLDVYDDAEIERKKIAAHYALFVTSPEQEFPLALDAGEGLEPGAGAAEGDELPISPGEMVRLAPGEEITPSQPADSGSSYEPFQYRTLLQVAAALGLPYQYVSGDLVKASFANSRVSLIDFRRRVEAYQHSVLVHQMCRPVWWRWLDMAVLAGRLELPGYERDARTWRRVKWLPTKWDWVDPLKDANAEIAQIAAGLKSRTQALAERGFDAEQVDQEIAADKARERALGLDLRAPGSPAASVQEAQPGDEDDGDDESDEEREALAAGVLRTVARL